MTRDTHRRDDETFHRAWNALARADRVAAIPDDLEQRILAAARTPKRPRTAQARWILAGVGSGLVAAGIVSAIVANRTTARTPVSAPAQSESTVIVDSMTSAVVRFAVDPVQETEVMQLVRLRVPRAAIAALDISIEDPAGSSLVDIDVLIGEDGLPRDIRRIAVVREADQPK